MNADQRLTLIRVKVERAKEHVADLDAAIRAFLDTHPYRVVRKENAQTGKVDYQVGELTPTPTHIPALIGDVIQNLRSALDHLANQLLCVRLGVEVTDQEFNFPICNTPSKYQSALDGTVKRSVRNDAFQAFKTLEAYKGGNGHQFWVLNRLNNLDKHRIILSCGSNSRSFNIGGMMSRHLGRQGFFDHSSGLQWRPQMDAFFRVAGASSPMNVGDVLMGNLEPEMEMDEKRDFTFDVTFNEPQIIECKPIVEVAQQFTDLVAGVIATFGPCLEQ